jgi:hypothetical protein
MSNLGNIGSSIGGNNQHSFIESKNENYGLTKSNSMNINNNNLECITETDKKDYVYGNGVSRRN